MLIRLSAEERNVLERLAGNGEVRFFSGPHGTYYCEMSEDTSADLSERCQDQLQLTGFDRDGTLTQEGRVLESLIDKLHIP